MAEITDILTKLLERTNQDKVRWQPTSDEQTFVAVLGNLSVMVLRDSIGDPVLKILNKAGREIEVLDGGVGSGTEWREDLFELHKKARRAALGVDSQLDELLKELESGA